MAANDNPQDRIPGTRSRFPFPSGDTVYAFIGPAIMLVLGILVGIYVLGGGWIGNNEGTKNPQPPAEQKANSK